MRFVAVSKSGKPAPRDQFLPWLAVDQDGWVNHAIWLDNRNDTKNVRIQTFESEGFTASHAASNTLLSTASWDPNRAFFSSGAFIGDYSGLAEGPATGGGTRTDEYEYPMWTDGRNSPGPPNGDTDVFTVPN
jgi:hypothetical protein